MVSLSFLIATAVAGGSYSFDMPIVGSAPPSGGPDTVVGWFQSWPVAPGEPDFTVQSSWPFVTCGVHGGSVFARFLASPTNWPTSFPSVVTCSHEGYTLQLHPVARPETPPAVTVPHASTSGISLSYPPLDGNPTGGHQVYTLDSLGFEHGIWAARDEDDEPWTDASCAVAAADGVTWLRVQVWPEAPAGVGACRLPLVGGGAVDIPLTITR